MPRKLTASEKARRSAMKQRKAASVAERKAARALAKASKQAKADQARADRAAKKQDAALKKAMRAQVKKATVVARASATPRERAFVGLVNRVKRGSALASRKRVATPRARKSPARRVSARSAATPHERSFVALYNRAVGGSALASRKRRVSTRRGSAKPKALCTTTLRDRALKKAEDSSKAALAKRKASIRAASRRALYKKLGMKVPKGSTASASPRPCK